MTQFHPINPYFHTTTLPMSTPLPVSPKRDPARWAKLPQAPITASPVPHLTSLYHDPDPGPFGSRNYPGNCSGNLIKDLLRFFTPTSVCDPLTGSGTCKDVCNALDIYCWSSDLRQGFDACDPDTLPRGCFEFTFIHPPYWRQKVYNLDPRCLSRAPTLEAFLERYRLLLESCARTLVPGGTLAVLMGDYCDREVGFCPLVYWTKKIAFDCGLRQCATDIVRFSHGASSGRKVYRSSFIPGLHDILSLFSTPTEQGGSL